MHRALILIPAFNEQTSIGPLVRAIRQLTLPVPFDVLVVDDGSRDATAQLAREAGAATVSLLENLGYGNALRAGYVYARDQGYDAVVQLDGDGQHDPESIPALVQPLLDDECDLVIGSRFHKDSDYVMSANRRFGQRFFSWMMARLGGPCIHDVTSGFQVLGPKALALYASDEFPSDYPDANVLLFSALKGLRIREVPAVFRARAGGASMHRGVLRPAYYIYKMLFSMLLVYARAHREMKG
jgi:glycosyltransferase involved in cell wall biosynthesis